jgi:hypothetical protein
VKDRISVQPADPDLAALLAADSWRAARVHARPATATWCPLIRFAESTKALGVTRAGPWWWGVEREDGWEIYPLEGDAVVGILPLLEMPFGALEHKARHSAIRLGIPPQRLLRTLPLATIIRAALATGSDYWVRLAVEWLEDSDIASQLQDAIGSAASEVRLEQSLRHRLRRLGFI